MTKPTPTDLSEPGGVDELANYLAEANVELAEAIRIVDSMQHGDVDDDELSEHVSWLKVYVDHIHNSVCKDGNDR